MENVVPCRSTILGSFALCLLLGAGILGILKAGAGSSVALSWVCSQGMCWN